MRHDDDDKPLPLSHLRTPVPLTEFDYAAVRARVRSELAQPRRPGWVVVFRLAALVVLLFVMLPSKREVVPTRPGGAAAASAAVARTVPAPEAGAAPQGPTARVAVARPRRKRKRTEPQPTAVSRIEIHTADPDIRIIWIVPKENS